MIDALSCSYFIKRQSCHHIETSQLICSANQLIGFYMMATLAFNDLNIIHIVNEKVPTVEKNLLQLVLFYLGTCKLGPNCKKPSNEYLTVVNYGKTPVNIRNILRKTPVLKALRKEPEQA